MLHALHKSFAAEKLKSGIIFETEIVHSIRSHVSLPLCNVTENKFKSVMKKQDEDGLQGVHLAFRAAAIDHSYSNLQFVTHDERKIVCKAVSYEVESLLLLPKLTLVETERRFDSYGSSVPGSVTGVSSNAFSEAIHLFRSFFEDNTTKRRTMDDIEP